MTRTLLTASPLLQRLQQQENPIIDKKIVINCKIYEYGGVFSGERDISEAERKTRYGEVLYKIKRT